LKNQRRVTSLRYSSASCCDLVMTFRVLARGRTSEFYGQ
jgi:hypothetical protein